MLSGTGVKGADGSAWYHPQRLTIDARSVGNGNANPAQEILDVDAIHGDDLTKKTRIYAFGAALGGEGVLDAATRARGTSRESPNAGSRWSTASPRTRTTIRTPPIPRTRSSTA